MQKTQNNGNCTVIIQMKTNQFPFGEYKFEESSFDQRKKIVVKKKYAFRSEKEKKLMLEKVNILKDMYHRNVINIRNIQETSDCLNIYYHYVHTPIEAGFSHLNQLTFKQLHKQLIQLAIHLAKNYILTSFNPARCGVIFIDNKFVVKYFLPLAQIVITQSRSMLERSVQLFKVQAIHMLDTLSHNDLLSDLSSHSEQQDVSREGSVKKKSMLVSAGNFRRMPNETSKYRKFSNFNSKLGDIIRKRSHDSTDFASRRFSGLKQTLQTFRINSERKRTSEKSRNKIRERVIILRARSEKALHRFQELKKQISRWLGLSHLIRLCNQL